MLEIPGYTIHEQIAIGGMSAIYLATQDLAGRKVIIKVMLSNDQMMAKRFIREVKINASLSHPNIITIFDVGELKGSMYLAMEYHPSGDLTSLLSNPTALREGRISAEERKNWEKRVHKIACALVSALRLAHSQRIFHRDLKPANILLRDNGDPVLTDFGIAIRSRDLDTADTVEPDSTRLTQVNTLLGTPPYMSPEQICCEEVDGRSDLYSFGLILYELLSGQRAVSGKNLEEILYKQRKEMLPPLPADYAHWNAVISKLTAKEKEDRFADADEVLQALEQLGRDKINRATSAQRGARSGKNKMLLAVLTMGAAVLAAGIGLGVMFYYGEMPGGSDRKPSAQQTTSPGRDGNNPFSASTGKILINDFSVTIPTNELNCHQGTPFKSGVRKLHPGEILQSGSCFALELNWNNEGQLYLLRKENGKMQRLFPNQCGNLGYPDGISAQAETVHFPMNEQGFPWVFQLDQEQGTETLAAVVATRDNTSPLQRVLLDSMPDICSPEDVELPAWEELFNAAGPERVMLQNRDWFELSFVHE